MEIQDEQHEKINTNNSNSNNNMHKIKDNYNKTSNIPTEKKENKWNN